MNLAALFIAQLASILCKVFQQRNTVDEKLLWGAVTSMVMACVDIWVVVTVVRSGWELGVVLVMGGAGACGFVGAVLAHRHLRGAARE